MLKRIIYIAACLILMFTAGCRRELMEPEEGSPRPNIPDGTPVTLLLPFASIDQYEVELSTKSEANKTDESRIQNLYVMVFDNNQKVSDDNYSNSPKKIYGRYFSYDHLKSPQELNNDNNECWFVQNRALNDDEAVRTKGAVKISTISCNDAIVVVIANVTNAVTNLDGINGLDRLKAVQHYKELRDIQVCLEQDIVNRKDLFLMTGELENVNTSDLMWNTSVGSLEYNNSYKVELKHVDAKVKFRVKVNNNYISAAKPVYWQVCNTPDRCYLYTKEGQGNAPEEIDHFSSQQYYFEGTEYDRDPVTNEIINTYYTFCFYMLENNQAPNGTAEKYYQREVRDKIDSGESGYKGKTGPESGAFGNHYVENGEWKYAPTYGTYVCFDLILTLTSAGITQVGNVDSGQLNITQALTSDAIFTVHLGDFANSGDRDLKDGTAISGSQFNNYETKRGHSYTYTITINNTTNIYAEVTNDEEIQAGQEGFLLLTDTEIINADCHYEYHQISFDYRPNLDQNKFSWYVKTPFGEGGPKITKNLETGEFTYDGSGLDYKWVLFGVNDKVLAEGDPGYVAPDGSEADPDPTAWNDFAAGGLVRPYSKKRHAYPGDSHYDPNWKPGRSVSVPCSDPSKKVPDLMDITQLIEYIFDQTKKEDAVAGSSDFIYDSGTSQTPVIRVTAFIDEYYYEKDPTNPNATVDPDLWRKFVNANPRELHILSDAKSSRDRKSDVIMSSHSVIQQSIQTFYNIYSADLQSIWGTEHMDEMRAITDGWPYWPLNPDSNNTNYRAGSFNTITGKENGRLNSAYIWKLYNKQDESGTDQVADWSTFLNYAVNNNTPELKEAFHGMAYSCMTRNRDNNGNGKIDRDEVRWYLAAPNQLIGMWVGNESLSISARLYRPAERQWRAHVLSSADRRVCWAEEGGGATSYSLEVSDETWVSYTEAAKGESVRCLRNIGTYYDESEGVIKDISRAPYKVRPQNYFTITPEPNENLVGVIDDPATHYVFSFDRLNPKSLREFTEGELPFNDQYSINNCAYLKMETQSRNDELLLMDSVGDYYPDYAYPYSISLDQLNEAVNNLGFNPYCPPGYRFPNQVENLLMSVYLPESFYIKDPYNNAYPESTVYMPTRTYFDRGCYGKNTEGFEYDRQGKTKATTREQQKVGWTYNTNSKKNTAAKISYKMSRSRCVRDVNMTGTIEGGLLMQDVLYPGDQVPLSFSFYSSGSTFISASLKFCYTDGNGVYHERDIPVQTAPSGLQYLASQTVKLPTIAEMDLGDMPLSSAKPKFKVTLRNAYISKTFEQSVTLGNPFSGDISLIGEEAYPSDVSQISFDISSAATACTLKSRKLSLAYTDKDGVSQMIELLATNSPTAPVSTDSLTYKRTKLPISIPNLSTLNLTQANVDIRHDATLILEVEDNGGSKAEFSRNIKLANPLIGDSITLSDATGDSVYPEDKNHISLGAQSKANTINISSVALELVPEGGSPVSIPLPGPAPSSKVYSLTDGEITIPALASLSGVSASDLDTGKNATLRVTYTAGDYNKTVEKDLTLSHPVVATTFTIDAVDNVKIYPADQNNVSLDFSSLGNTLTLSTATLQLYQGDTPVGSPIINGATIDNKDYVWSGAITIPSLSDLGLDATALDPGTAFSLKALVTSSATGLSKTLDIPLTLSNPISGSIEVPIGYIYSADDNTLRFSVSSLAKTSTLTSVSMKVEYTGIDGNTHLVTSGFSSLISPSGKSYSGDQTVTFPVFTSTPNVDAVDTSLPVTVTATFTSPGGITKDITCDNVPIRSHINVPVLQIPSDYTGSSPSYVFPIKAKLGAAVGGYAISAMKLQWKKNGETVWTTDTYDFDESEADFQTVSDASTRASLSLSTGSYINYRAMTICSTDGTATYSSVWSMWLARYNFAKSGKDKWSFPIQNLNIPGGDFIQASITETGGVDETNGQSVNKYELIGFGVGENESIFYPAQKSSTPGMAIHVQRRETNKIQVYGWWNNSTGWRYKKFGNFTNPIYINVLFNSNGLYYQNNNLFDPTVVDGRDNNPSTDDDLTLNIYNLIHTTSMVVGSAQGIERPLATYHFVRVVRQYEMLAP